MDIAKLKEAVNGALIRNEEIGDDEWYAADELIAHTRQLMPKADADLIAACSPAAVLELIGTIESLEARNRELEARIAELTQGEPALYQRRMRPEWGAGERWTDWEDCSAGSYEDVVKLSKLPHYNNWIYEARTLYTRPAAPIDDKEQAK